MRPVSFFLTLMAGTLLIACASEVSDSSSADIPDVQQSQAKAIENCPVLESLNWKAWIDTMPGSGSASLNVSGEIVLPSAGYQVSLINGPLDRRQPPAQRLRLEVSPPDGMSAQVLTPHKVEAKFASNVKSYRSVMIVCGDGVLKDITDIQTVQ